MNDSAAEHGLVEMHITDTRPGEPVLMLLNIILASAAPASGSSPKWPRLVGYFVEITITDHVHCVHALSRNRVGPVRSEVVRKIVMDAIKLDPQNPG